MHDFCCSKPLQKVTIHLYKFPSNLIPPKWVAFTVMIPCGPTLKAAILITTCSWRLGTHHCGASSETCCCPLWTCWRQGISDDFPRGNTSWWPLMLPVLLSQLLYRLVLLHVVTLQVLADTSASFRFPHGGDQWALRSMGKTNLARRSRCFFCWRKFRWMVQHVFVKSSPPPFDSEKLEK